MSPVANVESVVLTALNRVKWERWICKACAETTRLDPYNLVDDRGDPVQLACICGAMDWHHTVTPPPAV